MSGGCFHFWALFKYVIITHARMPAVSISFCKVLKQIWALPAVCVVAEATVTCAIHDWTFLGKKSPRNRFLFVKDWHMFCKITQDSLSKWLAAVTEQVAELLLHRQKSVLSWAQIHEDAHTVWHVQGEPATTFLFSEAWAVHRSGVVCGAGVGWLPSWCHAAAGRWHVRRPVRWGATKQLPQHGFGFQRGMSQAVLSTASSCLARKSQRMVLTTGLELLNPEGSLKPLSLFCCFISFLSFLTHPVIVLPYPQLSIWRRRIIAVFFHYKLYFTL